MVSSSHEPKQNGNSESPDVMDTGPGMGTLKSNTGGRDTRDKCPRAGPSRDTRDKYHHSESPRDTGRNPWAGTCQDSADKLGTSVSSALSERESNWDVTLFPDSPGACNMSQRSLGPPRPQSPSDVFPGGEQGHGALCLGGCSGEPQAPAVSVPGWGPTAQVPSESPHHTSTFQSQRQRGEGHCCCKLSVTARKITPSGP